MSNNRDFDLHRVKINIEEAASFFKNSGFKGIHAHMDNDLKDGHHYIDRDGDSVVEDIPSFKVDEKGHATGDVNFIEHIHHNDGSSSDIFFHLNDKGVEVDLYSRPSITEKFVDDAVTEVIWSGKLPSHHDLQNNVFSSHDHFDFKYENGHLNTDFNF